MNICWCLVVVKVFKPWNPGFNIEKKQLFWKSDRLRYFNVDPQSLPSGRNLSHCIPRSLKIFKVFFGNFIIANSVSMRVCKILAFSIYEWQLCHCNWWPEIQKSQFLPPPPSTQKLQTFTVFSCHRFSKKFSLPDRRARFHRFRGYLLRIFFIGLIILGIMVQNDLMANPKC